MVRTTLGPRGMDKLIHDENRVTISNDGASIMKLLDIVHPAARTLVDISLSQDSEVGDGTTSVVLLAGELLKSSKQFVEAGVPSQIIIRGFRRAVKRAVQVLNEIAVELPADDKAGQRKLLENCAGTALNSKLVRFRHGVCGVEGTGTGRGGALHGVEEDARGGGMPVALLPPPPPFPRSAAASRVFASGVFCYRPRDHRQYYLPRSVSIVLGPHSHSPHAHSHTFAHSLRLFVPLPPPVPRPSPPLPRFRPPVPRPPPPTAPY